MDDFYDYLCKRGIADDDYGARMCANSMMHYLSEYARGFIGTDMDKYIKYSTISETIYKKKEMARIMREEV